MMGRPRNVDDEIPLNAADGPPIAYSLIIAIPEGDPLLAALQASHGRDRRRVHDDLTAALARAASSKVRVG